MEDKSKSYWTQVHKRREELSTSEWCMPLKRAWLTHLTHYSGCRQNAPEASKTIEIVRKLRDDDLVHQIGIKSTIKLEGKDRWQYVTR